MAGPFSARPSSKSRTNSSRRYSGSASSNSSGKTETSAATAPAASDAPHADSPPRRRVASNAVGPVRNAAIIPTSLPLSKTRSCRPTSATARGVVSRSPISQAPRIPPSWRSMSGPIAESSAAAAIDRLAQCGAHPGIVTAPPPPRLIPKSILGVSIWVTVLLDKYLFYRPTYRLLGGLATPRPGPVVGHPDRRPATAGAAVRAGVRGLGEAQPRQQPLWHADETRWLVFVMLEGKVGYRWYLWVFHSRRGRDLRPGGRAVARRA